MKDRLDSEGGEQIGEKFQQQVDDRHSGGMMALIAQNEKTGKSEPGRTPSARTFPVTATWPRRPSFEPHLAPRSLCIENEERKAFMFAQVRAATKDEGLLQFTEAGSVAFLVGIGKLHEAISWLLKGSVSQASDIAKRSEKALAEAQRSFEAARDRIMQHPEVARELRQWLGGGAEKEQLADYTQRLQALGLQAELAAFRFTVQNVIETRGPAGLFDMVASRIASVRSMSEQLFRAPAPDTTAPLITAKLLAEVGLSLVFGSYVSAVLTARPRE